MNKEGRKKVPAETPLALAVPNVVIDQLDLDLMSYRYV